MRRWICGMAMGVALILALCGPVVAETADDPVVVRVGGFQL